MSGNEEAPARWTCEACGCHTNTEATDPVSCGVCGTNRMRMGAGGIPAGFHRLSSRFGIRMSGNGGALLLGYHDDEEEDEDHHDDGNNDEEEDQEMNVEDGEEENNRSCSSDDDEEEDDDDNSISSVAKDDDHQSRETVEEKSVISSPKKDKVKTSPKKSVQSLSEHEANVLLDKAKEEEAKGDYDLKWDHSKKGSCIKLLHNPESQSITEKEDSDIAVLSSSESSPSVVEGQCVRANRAIPRKGLFGWKVVFDSSLSSPSLNVETNDESIGKRMGGCYLLGVVTSTFSEYSERSGLQHSRQFYGIEDTGRKYEGPKKRAQSSKSGGVVANYGNMHVITILVDMDKNRIIFWRNEEFLGVLVDRLSSSTKTHELYPVAVPFNAGVCVAISKLCSNPLDTMTSYRRKYMSHLRKEYSAHRKSVCVRKANLLQERRLTPKAIEVLCLICSWYSSSNSASDDGVINLSREEATRLWYRCGIRLATLDEIISRNEKKEGCSNNLTSEDFIEVVQRIVEDEEAKSPNVSSNLEVGTDLRFHVGDIVELKPWKNDPVFVCNYSEIDGPLRNGRKRGRILEVVRGESSEKPIISITVSRAGKKGSYLPRNIVSERSGIIDCTAVHYLVKDIFHVHGFSPNLEPFWGNPFDIDKAQEGDYVISSKNIRNRISNTDDAVWDNIGRFCDVQSRRGRESRFAAVRYVDREADVLINDLIFTTFHHRASLPNTDSEGGDSVRHTNQTRQSTDKQKLPPRCLKSGVTSSVKKKIDAVRRLDLSTINALCKECRSSLVSTFHKAGLHDAILSALRSVLGSPKKGNVLANLIKLSTIFLREMLGNSNGQDHSSTSRNTSPVLNAERDRPDQLGFELFSSSGDNPSSDPNPISMERLFTSSLRDENASINIRELLRDLSAGPERQRNVLLALVASARDAERRPRNPSRSLSGAENEDGLNDETSNTARIAGERRNQQTFVPSTNTLPSSKLRRSPSPVPHVAEKASLRTLINDGLLIDNAKWVKRALRSGGGEGKAEDEEGNHILSLAISMGCSIEIITSLVEGGVTVKMSDIQKAATRNQVETLKLLLEHIEYNEEAICMTNCTPEVKSILNVALQQQIARNAAMADAATEFACQLVSVIVKLALQYHRDGNNNFCQLLTNALVGDVLLDALVKCQHSATGETEEKSESDDIRTPINMKQRINSNVALLDIIPSDKFVELLKTREIFVSFLLLAEGLLWSKTLGNIAVGFSIAIRLLDMGATISSEIGRFGFKELANDHISFAESVLSDLCLSDDSDGQFTRICCPKNHSAIIHLTKHSQFRCDLCGKSVKQGRPMHGCRECDWDACEDCTDKAEGGVVKWRFIKCKAQEFLKAYGQIMHQQNYPLVAEEVCNISAKLKCKDLSALEELIKLLRVPGKISLFEFSNSVLPSLASGLFENVDFHDVEPCRQVLRKVKKARVGSTSSVQSNASSFNRRGDFIHKLVDQLLEECQPHVCVSTVETKESTRCDSDDDDDEDDEEDGEKAEMETDSVDESSLGVMSRIRDNIPELIRYLHTVLAFNEKCQVFVEDGMLHALKVPIAVSLYRTPDVTTLNSPVISEYDNIPPPRIRLIPSEGCKDLGGSIVHVEPLMPLRGLHLHILRCCHVHIPEYLSFCRRLVLEQAIIAEQPLDSSVDGFRGVENSRYRSGARRIARVVSFDEDSGAHVVKYASHLLFFDDSAEYERVSDQLEFNSENVALILASRDYCILHREHSDLDDNTYKKYEAEACSSQEIPQLYQIGTRVESNIESFDTWLIYTVLSGKCTHEKAPIEGPSNSGDEFAYNLVSDTGKVKFNVPESRIRCQSAVLTHKSTRSSNEGNSVSLRARDEDIRERSIFQRGISIASIRRTSSSSAGKPAVGVLRRSWSALSPLNSMKPLDLTIEEAKLLSRSQRTRKISIGGSDVDVNMEAVELPPVLVVELSLNEELHPIPSRSSDTTVYSAFQRLFQRKRRKRNDRLELSCDCFYNISMFKGSGKADKRILPKLGDIQPDGSLMELERRFGTHRSDQPFGFSASDCEGLNQACITCLQVIDLLAEHSRNRALGRNLETDKQSMKSLLSVFQKSLVSNALTSKLLQQLEDPLSTVSGCLPSWCRSAPILSPHAFSHSSRKLFLERTTFGVSRAALRQQEAKVDVASLRERMASLRSRAVTLVGEAFSGGAADPTALQLQADELYGMEEALAERVTAAFRAQKWDEHSLECAKAAIRRDDLLADAAAVMDLYANDVSARRRRLEIRFTGESGFDAASGNEAGVTRGFYADVAESLLSCDNIAKLSSSTNDSGNKLLPLWIPDLDPSGSVIIPTPRADVLSDVGVYPRPIGQQHPQYESVVDQFRFMGRVFAAALRDGFVFPLPLSSSFLKLVQTVGSTSVADRHHLLSSSSRSESSCSDMSVDETSNIGFEFMKRACSKKFSSLTSRDLPRVGFLGGEISAVEEHICFTLDSIEKDSTLSESERVKRLNDIALDPDFARKVLGKTYDCSFNDYFEGKRFVDPLDPRQDEFCYPLCVDFDRPVNINNIREWVMLSKQFFLYDGVISQAKAFRQGVEDFFSVEALRLFTPYELQRDACGSGDNVECWDEKAIRDLLKLDGGKGTAEALVAVAAMGGEGGASLSRRFGPSSPTIGYLVKTLLEASVQERRQFLSFVTSVPIVTPGKIEVVPVVNPAGDFLPMSDPTCLPRANTCTRRLYLPKFESYQLFSKVLWAIVKEECKFKGFYEWRG